MELNAYGPWLFVFLSIFGSVILQLAKDEISNKTVKTLLNIGLFIMGAAGVIFGIKDRILIDKENADLKRTIESTKATVDITKGTVDSTKGTVDSTKTITSTTQTLTKLNLEITRQIDTLSKLNNALTSKGNNLISQNLSTTNNLSQLTENAKYLVDKIYDENLGGNSIPIISATTYQDIIPPPESEIDYKTWGDNPPTGNYLNILTLANTGDYKITDLSIKSSTPQGRVQPAIKELYDDNLQPFEVTNILTADITKLTPDPDSTDPDPHYYFISNWNGGDDGDPVTVTVHWRNITYYYEYTVRGGGSRNLYVTDFYKYKGKRYTKQKLIDKILSERLLAKKLRIYN